MVKCLTIIHYTCIINLQALTLCTITSKELLPEGAILSSMDLHTWSVEEGAGHILICEVAMLDDVVNSMVALSILEPYSDLILFIPLSL